VIFGRHSFLEYSKKYEVAKQLTRPEECDFNFSDIKTLKTTKSGAKKGAVRGMFLPPILEKDMKGRS
jgi:hypothetical protein